MNKTDLLLKVETMSNNPSLQIASQKVADAASLHTAKAIRDHFQNAVKFPNDTVYQRLERFIKLAHELADLIEGMEG